MLYSAFSLGTNQSRVMPAGACTQLSGQAVSMRKTYCVVSHADAEHGKMRHASTSALQHSSVVKVPG